MTLLWITVVDTNSAALETRSKRIARNGLELESYRLLEMTIISTTSRLAVNKVSWVAGVGNATLESSCC
jgi:hypothetical protein